MRYIYGLLGFGLLVGGCAVPESSVVPAQYAGQSTASLWAIQATTQSGKELAVVEAELGSRNELRSGTSYLGSRTSGNYRKAVYGRKNESVADAVDCSDFSSSAAAQKYFLSNGGPLSDPSDLDRDGDGFACEWGTTIQQAARSGKRAAARASRPRRVASSQCYVGPRGGTYTLTASGNKNYSGC